MIRTIVAAIMLALIAVHVAAGEEDLATQIRAQQKERLETLTELVEIYKTQYKAGFVSGEVLADAHAALVNAQLDAALASVRLDAGSKLPDAVIAIVENAHIGELEITEAIADRDSPPLFEWSTDFRLRDLASERWSLRLSQAEKDEREIKKGEKALVKILTELVKNYRERYKMGTVPLEVLVRAQAALLDARMHAAEKPEERAALLEEGAKSEGDLFKVADSKRKAAACSARSLFMDTKIRMLRQRGAKDDVAAQIKAAQKERVEALTELVKIDTELWKTGWTGLATLTQAKADLVNARVDAADASAAKILVLTEAAKEQAEVVHTTEVRAQVGYMDTKADVYRERLHLLDFKIRLLQERGRQDARDR
jgi:hypothetical protein